ncbi:unnamed protein product [Rotaria sp. Silwood2]|nr:unnamed protein product [Rotaria sp. Silwood2]CAF2512667.1 unnamed protein product [Rotaria sp. Silwood2]CAF2721179.1 unnamed protein product [Rotaria sp. Silwood2]CAF2891020.1 unnamed protein product [Rotaria sp. Silwood2]CAF3913608.1 unnamed protein product [Rotaria sp. Silwood2]
MDIFYFYLTIICITLTMTVSKTVGSKDTDDDDSFQDDEDLSIEIPRQRSNTFLRAFNWNDDDDDSQDNSFIKQERTFIRRDDSNSTYRDRNGRLCILCKWNILPCCEPNICKKHHIRFNECVEIKGR